MQVGIPEQQEFAEIESDLITNALQFLMASIPKFFPCRGLISYVRSATYQDQELRLPYF